MCDGEKDAREPHIVQMGVRTELQSVETHRHAPGSLTAECPGKKIRNLKTAVVNPIAATAGQSGRVKVHVRQRDVLSGITPAALELAAGELPLSAYIDTPRPHHAVTPGFPEIHQIATAALPETPLWFR